jgi:hypothetical protein
MTDSTPAVSETPKHGMSRRLERAAADFSERTPVSVARTMLDGAQCIDALWNIKAGLVAHIRTLEASLADARRDAERYRFARDGAPADGPFIADHFRNDRSDVRQLTGAIADHAIDAAMSGGTGE